MSKKIRVLIAHLFLAVLAFIWVIPIIWVILTSFKGTLGSYSATFYSNQCGAYSDYYTVAVGMYKMLEQEYIAKWYGSFAAAAVIISIPIAILFLCTQKYYAEGVSGAVKG